MENIRPHFDVMLTAIAAGRVELIRLQREGRIEDDVLHDLERDLDLEELGIIFQRRLTRRNAFPRARLPRSPRASPLRR